jgi:arylsulfatase A-like enzyme
MLVILYVLDALRADHLSCYGYSRKVSPNIDQLAADGALFRNCFAPATWTRPVAASILSGVYPLVHGTRTRTDRFSPSIVRLPESLQDAGFDTTAFSAMANVSIAGGFAQGFAKFVELFRDESVISHRRTSTTMKEGVRNLEGNSRIALPRSEDINEHLLYWLRHSQAGNKFAFIWSIDTHDPYDPPLGFDKFIAKDHKSRLNALRESVRTATKQDVQLLIDLYDSEIHYNDYHIGQLIDELKRLDLYDDSLIVITGDHGEAFYEHGVLSHGHVPYEELIHVPLILKFPGNVFAGCQISALVELTDLCPTILDWMEMDEARRQVRTIQGKSLLPLLRGEQTELRRYVYSETGSLDFQNTYLSVRGRRWKYIETRSPPRSFRALGSLINYIVEQRMLMKILSNPLWFLRRHLPRQRGMLFDLDNDPLEQHDLLYIEREEADRLRNGLVAWERSNQALAQSIGVQPYNFVEDEVIRRHLEELGYM